MSKKRTTSRLLNALVLTVLVLGSMPMTGPALSHAPADIADAPQAPPPPGGLFRLAPPADPPIAPPVAATAAAPAEAPEVEKARDASPAEPAAPQMCTSGPQKATFGQDLELFLGPMEDTVSKKVVQDPAWAAVEVAGLGPVISATTGCTTSGPKLNEVYFYAKTNHSGACAVLTAGQYPVASDYFNIGSGNNLASLKVGSNVEVTVWKGQDYGGNSRTFAPGSLVTTLGPPLPTADCWPTVCNNQASSAKVYFKPLALGNLSVAATGSDSHMVLMKILNTAGNQEVVAMPYYASSKSRAPVLTNRSSANGSPVAVRLGPDLAYFVRSDNTIYALTQHAGTWDSAWRAISGTTGALATSDPVVIVPDVYHMRLFYVTTGGEIKFTEWASGTGWWAAPVSLGKPSTTTFVELNAVARDDNHIAVFGVGADGNLYAKQWSNANNFDWSDVTTWDQVATSVKTTIKPGVASRHMGHVGFVYVSTATGTVGRSYYREWSAGRYEARQGSPRGWFDRVDLGEVIETNGLVATDGNQMFAYGVNSSGTLYTNEWAEASAWGGWASRATGWVTQTVAAVSGRPRDVTFYGRNTSNRVVQVRYSNLAATPTTTTLGNPGYGKMASQAVAVVQGKTYWVSAYLNSTGVWTLDARNTANWASAATADLTAVHGTAPTSWGNGGEYVDLAAGDVDLDGDDEIIVATVRSSLDQWQDSVYKVEFSGSTPLLVKKSSGGKLTSSPRDIQVAIGDLDGDGNEREFAVAWHQSGTASFIVRTYRVRADNYALDTLAAAKTVDFGNNWDYVDREMTIGQVHEGIGEQIILTVDHQGELPVMQTYQYVASSGIITQTHSLSGPRHVLGQKGAYSSALAVGDVDGDFLEEAVFTWGDYVQAVNVDTDTWTGPWTNVSRDDQYRSLAVDDVEGDGRAEIVYIRNNDIGSMGILKLNPDPARLQPDFASDSLFWTARLSGTKGVPLLADLDGDSPVATRTGCYSVSDVQVVGVVNAQPLWHNGTMTEPGDLQYAGGGMANSNVEGTQDSDGWHTSFGASLELGLKVEANIPVLGIKIGEVRASVKQGFESKFGQSNEREDSDTETDGASFGAMTFGVGAVCYTYSYYECYTYLMSRGTYTSTAMNCLPTIISPTQQLCMSLEDWYDSDTIRNAGSAWVPVGHHPPGQANSMTVSHDLNFGGKTPPTTTLNYPALSVPPVDSSRIWWVKKEPICVRQSINPQSTTTDWSISRERSDKTSWEGSFDVDREITAGADILAVTLDASYTVGAGGEWSSGVSWGSGIEFNGAIFPYIKPSTVTHMCEDCTNYWIKPFIYKAKAETVNGFTYDYLEQDYFVTSYSACPLVLAASESESIVGLAPKAPVVTSPTHPDPATWYPADTVTFNWSQPPGDPAVVIGYRWNINNSPVSTPTALEQMTTTHTYQHLADGLYYLHIQARGDGGDVGPTTHLAFRVDTGAPQVKLLPDPAGPDGSNSWYITPITFAVAATDPNGSGVASSEASWNGTTWQPYTAPILIAADTPGRTLWARATDNLGHVSTPVSTTLKLDLTPPILRDSDRQGVSYARTITDEVGNAQLVLGGAISDALSGRLLVQVKAGETGLWNNVSQVGDLPMPPGNIISTSMTSLQWIYTPTFEIRGVYPIYVRGADIAGNQGLYYSTTLPWVAGILWWEPDDVPVLDESRVSVSPHQAQAGDVVVFTVAARNSGYQEAQYRITDTVPAGLTVLPDSITDGGQYNASTRQIVWTLHAAWPAQTRYLFFQATADSTTTTATLENRVDLMAYWLWDTSQPGIPPEPARHYYSTSTTLTVLPGAPVQASAASRPHIMVAAVAEGDIVGNPDVTLVVNASPEARYLYVREWVWNASLNNWSQAKESGWVPFETAAGLAVSEDESGRYGRYDWTLSDGDGVKYLGLWVADADGQISNLNEANLIYTNLLSPGGQQLAAGQRTQYRVWLRNPQLAVLSAVSLIGDADLYVWKPRAGFMPHYYSNAVPAAGGLGVDSVAFYAPEEGLYVIEVEAATDATYRLVTAGDFGGAGLLAQTQAEALPASTHLSLADKERPAHPLTLTTPFSVGGIEQLPTAPKVPKVYRYYMPIIWK